MHSNFLKVIGHITGERMLHTESVTGVPNARKKERKIIVKLHTVIKEEKVSFLLKIRKVPGGPPPTHLKDEAHFQFS
jgi:hypothetical protein